MSVEPHAGRGIRTVPIFPGLQPHLERAYRERDPGEEFVVPQARGRKTQEISTPGRDRTCDLSFRKAPLYPTELRERDANCPE